MFLKIKPKLHSSEKCFVSHPPSREVVNRKIARPNSMHLVIKTIDELQKVFWTGKRLKVDKIVVTNADRVNEM